MPKLIVDLDIEIMAAPFYSSNAGKRFILGSQELRNLVTNAKRDDFSLNIVSIDTVAGYANLGFPFLPSGTQAGGSFEYSFDFDEMCSRLKMAGTFASSSLRAGVAPMLAKNEGADTDLRISGFNFKGGEWDGFAAPIIGQPEDDLLMWIKVVSWRLK